MLKIAVDVTPLLPGGVNGGAKPMILTLLQELPRLLPEAEFILWTADYSHEELAFLDKPNLKRICVHHAVSQSSAQQPMSLKSIAKKVWDILKPWLPPRLQNKLKHFYYQHYVLPIASSSVYKQQPVDFLFCPFGAPTFYNPNIPTLSIIYDLQFLEHPEFFSEQEQFYRQLHFNQISELADHVATISEYTRQCVLKYSALLPEQVTTIHIGSVHEYSPQVDPDEQQKLLEQLGLRSNGYLFYPANFWPHKNHKALLQGFQIFRQKYPDSDLKMVFTGALDDRRISLLTEAEGLGLGNYLIMPGFLPDHEIGILYRSAKGLIFPSLYEGFGIPLMEAMQAGLPVASSNITSLPEVGGDAALYFDPKNILEIGQAIETLALNDTVCKQLIQKGRERLLSFDDAQTMSKSYAALIQRMLIGSRQIYRYGLHGLTEDGWFQENAYLMFPTASGSRMLEFSFQTPEWLPTKMEIAVTSASQLLATYSCEPGNTLNTSLDLPVASGIFEIRFKSVYTPASLGIANDPRLLSVLCQLFQIKSDGPTILFDALHKN